MGKKQTFLLSYLNEFPELLCGLSCDHSWSQTIPMGNSPWEKKNTSGCLEYLADSEINWEASIFIYDNRVLTLFCFLKMMCVLSHQESDF